MIRSIVLMFCMTVASGAMADSAAEQMWQGFHTAFDLFNIQEQTQEDHEIFSGGYKACFQSAYSQTDYKCIQSISEMQWLVMKSALMELTSQEFKDLNQYKMNAHQCSDTLDMKSLIGQCIDTALGIIAKPAIYLLYKVKGRQPPDFDEVEIFREQFNGFQSIAPRVYAREIAPVLSISDDSR